jgi:hypothetical protein
MAKKNSWSGLAQINAGGKPPKGGVGPGNSFGYQGSWGNGVTPGYTQPTPGAAPASAPAPAGPAAATPEDPRISAYYNQSVKDATSSRDNSLYDIDYDVSTGANRLGFSWDKGDRNFDPTRAATIGVDPKNPFSKMSLLQHSYEQTKAGTSNSYASMGQHNSGAFARMNKENQFQNDAAAQELRNAFQDLIQGGRKGTNAANDQYSSSISGAASDALKMALGG